MAVEVWSKYQGAALSARGLDRALGAFDMFVLHDKEQDLDWAWFGYSYTFSCVANLHADISNSR